MGYVLLQAVAVVSEGLECFGGAGYLEDTGIPHLLRDTQVLPIWEGTTNILSLDALRAISKSQGQCLRAYHEDVTQRVSAMDDNEDLKHSAIFVKQAASDIVSFAEHNMEKLELAAREFSYSLARVYIGMYI
ncbi:hypothetical protein LSH36_2g02021 [Paralvinella palmiformis]|uniref:Acyl-CoA dehydrogenase/oxidase C-terminal domain-containing protein n=1 Tax=Paralvinella palmiformis TaxID=53620 RepID=A0AAD9KG17_9ANNE|nr:hypothetical protein LSH36_2g02021 [Paralvinella palmiformis]